MPRKKTKANLMVTDPARARRALDELYLSLTTQADKNRFAITLGVLHYLNDEQAAFRTVLEDMLDRLRRVDRNGAMGKGLVYACTQDIEKVLAEYPLVEPKEEKTE